MPSVFIRVNSCLFVVPTPACRTGKMSVFQEILSRVRELGLRVRNAGCLFLSCSE